jgi:hypothetical protein
VALWQSVVVSFFREDTMKAISLRACWLALFIGIGALVAVPTVVDAQATKETAPAKDTKEKKPAVKKERTAKSKECSAEADKLGLKGKERRKFRSKCKRGKS